MTLAEAIYTRSNSAGRELQPCRPHRSPSLASNASWEERSPSRLVAMEKALSNQPRMQALRFGRFRLVLHSRELLADGVPLSIGNRALDVLFALIEAQGELVTKDELLSRVWPDTTVEENNLQFQVSTLRKAFGEDRDVIRTVSGRGYRFVAEITAECRSSHLAVENDTLDGQAAVIDHVRDLSDPGNLAEPTSDIVGRETSIKDRGTVTAANRLITLVGADGIGKTRLAIKLARRTLPTFANDESDVELGRVLQTGLITTPAASAAGLGDVSNSLERTTALLTSKHLLDLLDSCELILETITGVAEAVIQASAKR
jgi:DNA-binding winged helix-turn-helix (wHTH) protein